MQKYLWDRIKGLVYGQAIGDAWGLGTEFMNKQQVNIYYSKKLTDYQQIINDKHRSHWQKGEWTDDTDQFLCILDSILEKQEVDYFDIAKKIHYWAYNGGKGIGNTVYQVLSKQEFIKYPHQTAQLVWEMGNRQIAANGAIMRTSILGVWDFEDLEKVRLNTENIAKITHFDPRCTGSCIALTVVISSILAGEGEYNKLLNLALEEAKKYDERIIPFLEKSTQSLESFDLDEPNSIGYTLKALGAAFWALKHDSFENAISAIIHEGGDADTNAAVAGALLGAKLGYSQLPIHLVTGLKNKGLLDEKLSKLAILMNIDIKLQETIKVDVAKTNKKSIWKFF